MTLSNYGPPDSPTLDSHQTNILTRRLDDKHEDVCIRDDIKNNLLGSLSDTLHAAWNGWEQACKFDCEEGQDYYMKIVRLCDDTMKKVKKLQ